MNERALFEAALDIADPAARIAFIDESCAGNQELRERIETLLRSHDAAGSFLEVPLVGEPKTGMHLGTEGTVEFTGQADFDNDQKAEEVSILLGFLESSAKVGSIGKLAHYEILCVLGQGGFGIVLKAFDEKLHRLVAIKALSPQMAATSPPRKRFLREARAAAAIRHENVVQVYSVEEQPLPYLVMEFVDGQTIQQTLDGVGPLETTEVLHIGRQIANGLAAAHSTGLIHRDIKPGNILLESGVERKVKITDFGLARTADDASMTRTGTVCGTPMYMAPEQALGQTVDYRADLFSFGSVLYQMACGRPPFRAPSTIAVLRRVADEAPRPLKEIIPEIPDWLVAIIDKLHAKQPAERFQTAKEVADLMTRCQAEWTATGMVTATRCLERPVRQALQPTVGLASSVDSNIEPQNSNRERSIRTFAIAAGLLLAVTAIYFAGTSQPKEIPSKADASSIASVDHSSLHAMPHSTVGWQGWPADAPSPAIAPFSAQQAKQYQEAWAEYLKVPVEYINGIGMKLRLIPPGEFMMGSTPSEITDALPAAGSDTQWQDCIRSEGPLHRVVLTQPIYLGVNEVTQAQYQQVMATNPSFYSPTGKWAEYVAGMNTSHFPVEGVRWDDAAEFCKRLSATEKNDSLASVNHKAPTTFGGDAYRLPSEAEWEFACRAGTSTLYHTGETNQALLDAAWFTENSDKRTHPVGELKSNSFGLFDMHGNVWEWALDAWDANWYAKSAGNYVVNPFNAPVTDSERMTRGGNYSSNAPTCRSRSRCSEASSYNATLIGFRVSLDVNAVR